MPTIEIVSKTCSDCYRCLRRCHVHAITVSEGHARVSAEHCLSCGQCVRECPRRAIRVRRSLPEVKEMIVSGATVIASVALLESARVRPVVAELMPTLLQLGFAGAEATTRALRPVWTRYREFAEKADQFVIASGCPAAASLVEQHYVEALPLLAPVVSYAEAHARMIKARARSRGHNDVKVVHIAPEPAVKGELRREDEAMTLDAALTFQEIRSWVRAAKKSGELPATVAPGEVVMDDVRPPLDWVRDILPIYGLDLCVDFLKNIPKGIPHGTVIDLATCRHGCALGSPRLLARVPEASAFLYPEAGDLAPAPDEDWTDLDLSRTFADRHVTRVIPTDEQVSEIMRAIGVKQGEQALNCGACSYDTCREMAAAIFEGMAEVEMCLPYMRREAHRISLILHNTTNGVLLVNRDMRIEFANPAFRTMFHQEGQTLKGRLVGEVLENNLLEQALEAGKPFSGIGRLPALDLVYRAQIFPIEGEPLLAAVLVDISEEVHATHEFTLMREATLGRAQEVITRQMKTAQEIAGLLGETTAETKALLVKLMDLARRESMD